MNEGLMFVFNESDMTLKQKVIAAVCKYYDKLGQPPDCVHVNEGQLDGQDVQVEGLRVVGAANLPPHHFWVGVEE